MAPKFPGFEPDGLSRVVSYAGEIPQSATKAKNDHRIFIEEGISLDIGILTSGTRQQGHKNLYQKTQNMRGYWLWTH